MLWTDAGTLLYLPALKAQDYKNRRSPWACQNLAPIRQIVLSHPKMLYSSGSSLGWARPRRQDEAHRAITVRQW